MTRKLQISYYRDHASIHGFDAMLPYFPRSATRQPQPRLAGSEEAVETARRPVADLIARTEELIFTSGASSRTTRNQGVAEMYARRAITHHRRSGTRL